MRVYISVEGKSGSKKCTKKLKVTFSVYAKLAWEVI